MTTKRVMLVAVSSLSFKLLEEKQLYAHPMEYSARTVDYLAFYRPRPISAVTHYGKIKQIELHVHPSKYFVEIPSWVKSNSLLKCYRLKWLKKLPFLVKREKHNAIIRPVYTDLKTLMHVNTLKEIFQKRNWI